MLRAEVRALADNLKDAENRARLQVSLCEHTLLAAQLVQLKYNCSRHMLVTFRQSRLPRACLVNSCLHSHVLVAVCAATAVLTTC